MLPRAMANKSLDDVIRLPLKHCTNPTKAADITITTIQCACSARSNASATGNCASLFNVCQGATWATAEITTQKKTMPVQMVSAIAMKNPAPPKSELASSQYFPTDSKPDSNHGTICQTSSTEISGARLNQG